jgi:kumamolisin
MTHIVKQPPDATPSSHRPSPDEVVVAVFLVRQVLSSKKGAAALQVMACQLPGERRYLTPAEVAQAFSANPADVDRVASYAGRLGFKILEANPQAAHIVIEGKVADFEKAFGITFVFYHHPRGDYRSYKGRLRLPAKLNRLVTGVIGLDNRSMARPLLHHPMMPGQPKLPATKVAGIYHYPKTSGKGQCIGIVSLGGGIYRSDIKEYFRQLGLPQPKVDLILSDGVKNQPAKRRAVRKYLAAFRKAVESGTPPTDSIPADLLEQILWTIETTIDIELAGTFAPGARIAVYLGENTEAGKVHVLANAVTDHKRRPSVISCSWGALESDSTQQYFDAMASLFLQAGLRGITLCIATGDEGSPDTTSVNFPSSSPWVLACGGTSLSRNGAQEKVWYEPIGPLVLASCGGFSTIFPLPSWQKVATAKDRSTGSQAGRAVPDVAAKADLLYGYSVMIAGIDVSMGGTSAAAPAWAGLIARLNEKMKARAGYLTELLYSRRFRHAMRDVVKGHTQSFKAHSGWDACTGWGSPVGIKLLKALEP